MMGKKERCFAPLINVSLEDLVPVDDFYRHLDRTLDLSFVREFVQETCMLTNPYIFLYSVRKKIIRASSGLASCKEVQFMKKHVYSPIVLVCTLSTRCEGNQRMLPSQSQVNKEELKKKIPGRR